jgi:hypothetical protein
MGKLAVNIVVSRVPDANKIALRIRWWHYVWTCGVCRIANALLRVIVRIRHGWDPGIWDAAVGILKIVYQGAKVYGLRINLRHPV